MAKQDGKNTNQNNSNEDENSNTPVDNKPEAPVEAAVAPEEKLVRFHPLMNHKCRIGNVQYILVKEQECRIPENIAVILSNARKGFRK
jgi:hypothetical protein